jgi:hypothetical protein
METFWVLWSLEKQNKGGMTYEQVMVFQTLKKLLRFVVICGMSMLLSSVCDPILNRSDDPEAVLEDFM